VSNFSYTYCDVEHAVQQRLSCCNLLAAYSALRAAEVERAERELLRRLKARYDGAGEPAPAPILHSGRPPSQKHKPTPAEQSTLI
jgi:hypothetical protein